MKKIGLALLVGISALSLWGCSSSSTSTSSSSETTVENSDSSDVDESEDTEEGTEVVEASSDPITTAYEGKTIIMGTNVEFPPYVYYEGGEVVGIDAEISEAIANELGATLEISDMAFDAILPAVQSEKIDFGAGGITVTEDRKKNVDFTDTYAGATQAIIVLEGSDITTVEDLEGKQIGVQQGTTGDLYITDDFGDSSVQRFPKATDAIQALHSDKVDCVVIDDSTARAYLERNSDLVILDTAYAVEEYAFCVKKGNEELLNAINQAIANLKESGELDAIIAKYTSDEE